MGRILYLVPGSGMPDGEMKRRERLANSFLINPEKNSVFVRSADDGPLSIESYIESEMSVGSTLKHLISLKGEYDAVIIGCADDPGIASVRELLDVPVIGPFESSVALATTLGESFGVATILDEVVPETRVMIRKMGYREQLASVRAVQYNVLNMMDGSVDETAVVNQIVEVGRKLVEDGASSIVLGCMTLAFLLVDEPAGKKLGIPVVNPAKAAVAAAEVMLATGLLHSRISYPKPNFEKLAKSVLPTLKEV